MKSVRTAVLALLAAVTLAISTDSAAAATVTFSNNGGTGAGMLIAPHGFDVAFRMAGNNNNHPDILTTWSGTSGLQALQIDGRWRYGTHDARGAQMDPLFYAIGGVFTQLSRAAPSGLHQRGRFSFLVPANTSFSWVLGSTDGRHGRGQSNIFANITPATVPLPAGGLLLLAALGCLAPLRRRRVIG